jgi:diguanylate cyclase (GGDEF)-like protein/PAS domain S-box-containing protein
MGNFSEAELEQALNECAAEPIHQIGTVQPHGALLVLSSGQPRVVLQASANLASFLALPPDGANGHRLADLIGDIASGQVEQLIEVAKVNNSGSNNAVGKLSLSAPEAKPENLAHLYLSDGMFVLEIEPDDGSQHGLQQEARFTQQLFQMQQQLLLPLRPETGSETLQYFEQIARLVRALTDFDSVMIYRFDANADGEIIVQERAASAPSYLGLHFPASDIPPQARRLYAINLVRVVADVAAVPVAVLPALNPATGQPLDMTYSALRSLSPIHIEYLGNMGVQASMVMSLLQNGRLWGMIACHHLTPKRVSMATREIAIFIGKMASARLSALEAIEQGKLVDKANQIVGKLLKLITTETMAAILHELLPQMQALVDATGIIMVIEGKPHLHGSVLGPDEIDALLTWLTTQSANEVFACDYLGKQFAPANAYSGTAAGVLRTPLANDRRNYIVWLREEKPRTVHWAGNAQKSTVRDASGNVHLTPRKSFAIWAETCHGRSTAWTSAEIGIATTLGLALPEGLAQKSRLDLAQEMRQRAERSAADARQQLELMTAAVPGVVYQFLRTPSGEWRFPFVSSGVESLFEVTAEEACRDHNAMTRCILAEDRAAHRESIESSANSLGAWVHEHRIRTSSGRLKWVRGQALPQLIEDGSVLWNGLLIDITERKNSEAVLQGSEEKYRALVETTATGYLIIDGMGRVLDANQEYVRLTGHDQLSDILGKPVTAWTADYEKEKNAAAVVRCAKEGLVKDLVIDYVDGNGRITPIEVNATVVGSGESLRIISLCRDITERKAAADEIEYLAFYDSLTGLPNRRLMLDRLLQAQNDSARHRRHGALMLIDLDNFKILNDTLGHDVGDQLLVEVALRLKSCIRDGDTTARLGGDEFVIILKDLDETDTAAMQAEHVAAKIQSRLGEAYVLDVPVVGDMPGKRTHHCTSSIGITLFSHEPVKLEELLKRADTAMYQAKAAGRNTLRFFDPEMQSEVTARAALEDDLRKAIVEQQFFLHYQLQVDRSFNVIGAEALVRWQHPERGLVSPLDFIPLAEETGLILPIGHWVLETACRLLAAWTGQPALANITLAVNISARQFSLPNIVEQVLALIEHTGAPPDKLKLEFTESLLFANAEDIIAKMTALKAHGVGFSLDDFGTGYSSLSYLKRLPLDQLKIDRSFVQHVLTDPNDAAIARTIVALGQTLGLAVIAEGVETEAQRSFLANAGCDAYQGYLFGRPLPPKEFEDLIQQLSRLQAADSA